MIRALSPVRPFVQMPPKPAALSQGGPRLRLDPLVWLKLQFFASTWDCAVGGFGLTAGDDDPLHVGRFMTVPQHVAENVVHFDAAGAAADAISAPLCRARRRRRRSRPRPRPRPSHVLILTHAGTDPAPTDADEALLAETLGHRDWSALLIIARGGHTYARLSLSTGPVRALSLTVEVDWMAWARFVEDQPHQFRRLAEAWKDEYARHVHFTDSVMRTAPASPWPDALLGRLRRGQLFTGPEDDAAMPSAPLRIAH